MNQSVIYTEPRLDALVLEDLTAVLLDYYGVKAGDRRCFFHPEIADLHDPFLFQQMEITCERLIQAIEKGERIMVFGDFDTDGITSTAILVDGLKALGALVSYRIPDRNLDSHGLKHYHVQEMAEKKVDLIITCDCGINDQAAVELANDLGMEVIITDHHQSDLNRLPACVAIVNPQVEGETYPDTTLSGAGVALKVIQALALKKIKDESKRTAFLAKYLEAAAVGHIADCMPLTGEGRLLAQLGLQAMAKSQWTGINTFLQGQNKAAINEDTVGFQLAPRLNATSRVGDVIHAVQLFLGNPAGHGQRLNHLHELNEYRKNLTKQMVVEAEKQIDVDRSFIWVEGENWETGILGLVGSKLTEKYNRPVVALKPVENGFQSSCRAPKGYDIITALKAFDGDFNEVGGHAGAAGFTINRNQKDALKDHLDSWFLQTPLVPVEKTPLGVVTDFSWLPTMLDIETPFRPFGIAHPQPLWQFWGEIVSVLWMGKNKDHLKISLANETGMVEAVQFFVSSTAKKPVEGQTIKLFGTIQWNYFGGIKSPQIMMEYWQNVS